MANETNRPNYFLLLDLDLNYPWDKSSDEAAAAVVTAAISKKRGEWSTQSNSPSPKISSQAKKYRAMISDIELVMTDAAKRNAELTAARQEKALAGKERIAALEAAIKFANERGYLEPDEFDKLVADFKDVATREMIEKRVTIRKTSTANTTTTPKLANIDAIETDLHSLHEKSLYTLLGKPQNAPSGELVAEANTLYSRILKAPKNPDNDARKSLSGHAQVIFASEEKRQAYNESLRVQSLKALFQELDENMNRLNVKTLKTEQIEAFLKSAGGKGWKKEEAFKQLRAHGEERKWIILAQEPDRTPQQRCGYCDAINSLPRPTCIHCNKPLKITCPDCGLDVPSDEAGCKNCGFPVGNAFWVEDELNAFADLLKHDQLKSIEEHLQSIERAWPARKDDERKRKLHNYRGQLQSLVQEQQKSLAHLRQLIDQKYFYGAQHYIARLPAQQLTNEVTPYKEIIGSNIERSRELMKQAQAPTISLERKMDLCLQAIHICADSEEAHAFLSTHPPAAPGNLQARVTGQVVSLSWQASSSNKVSYKIVRKSQSRPSSLTDGKLLSTITGTSFDDAQPEIGLPLFYAVFAAYGEITSAQPALLAQPVFLTGDVTNVAIVVESQLVDIKWKLPGHVDDVVVVRTTSTPPASYQDGTRLVLMNKNHMVDRTVQDNQNYYYGIYCLFQDFNRQLLSSPGVIRQASPEAPPRAIEDLHIQSEQTPQGSTVRLSWKPPAKGQVVILKSTRAPALRVQERISSDELTRYGILLQGRADTLTDQLNSSNSVYYTPIVIFQQNAYIGTTQRYANIEDITNLEVEPLGTSLRLQWTWPKNCQEAVICFDYTQWVSPEQASTNIMKVTRSEYEYRGHYDISGAMDRDYFITVAAMSKEDGETTIARGVRHQTRLASHITLGYEIKKPGLLGPKQAILHLTVRTPADLRTGLVLISKQGGLPVTKKAGERFFHLPGPIHIENQLDIPIPEKPKQARLFGKLYLEDDTFYDQITIHHPGEDKLRLS